MDKIVTCPNCGKENTAKRYFCMECGTLLNGSLFPDKSVYEDAEFKVMRII